MFDIWNHTEIVSVGIKVSIKISNDGSSNFAHTLRQCVQASVHAFFYEFLLKPSKRYLLVSFISAWHNCHSS